MLEGLLHLFSRRPVAEIARDAADVLLVAFLAYRALLLVKGTRAGQMGLGVLLLGGLYAGAKYARLVSLVSLLDVVLTSLMVILVIVFQNDIRRVLVRLGERAFFTGLSRAEETKVIDEVVAAAAELARHRIGALIAFEQNGPLEDVVVDQGTPVDAEVSKELLVTLFQPEAVNQLHDGSVIIRNLRIAAAGVFFPMPESRAVDPSFGSRHRAAMGITEETDAVVVVVSEERGAISVCFRGNVIPSLDGQRLRAVLLELLGYKEQLKKEQASREAKEQKDQKEQREKEQRDSRDLSKEPRVPIPPVSRPPVSRREGEERA